MRGRAPWPTHQTGTGWAFGKWKVSPFPLGRKPKADKPPKPEVVNARVSAPAVSPAKAKAICRRSASLTKASKLS